MPPETVELIEKIEVERSRVRELLREVEDELDDDGVVVDDQTLAEAEAEAADDIETLRRAGLIPA